MDSEIAKKLQEPFPPEDIEWRVGATNQEKTKGIALAYITNRAIQARLDEVFGPFNWQNQYREWKGTSQICGISIWDDDKKQWITKWDGADDSATEAVKGGLSDSMKRAGYQWGIGRYLYNLENAWVDVEKRGNSCYLKSEPKLPAWALPGGSGKPPAGNASAPTPAPPPVAARTAPAPPSTDAATEMQIKKIFASAREIGVSNEDIKDLMWTRYGKSGTKDLTKTEASEIINYLETQKKTA